MCTFLAALVANANHQCFSSIFSVQNVIFFCIFPLNDKWDVYLVKEKYQDEIKNSCVALFSFKYKSSTIRGGFKGGGVVLNGACFVIKNRLTIIYII